MNEKYDEYQQANANGVLSINNTNNEYQSPDTELKFLEELVKKDDVVSNTFKITKGAYNKAMTYAKAIGQIAGTGMECYGYLLKPADSLDNVVTDIFLAPNQTNQAAYVRVSAEGVYQSSQEIEPRGLMMVGWWHSHGTFSTFHSGTDVRNFEIVLHSIAPRTMYKNEKGQYTYNKDEKELMITGAKIKGLELPSDAKLEVIRKVEQDPYAYSMVVNMHRSCYLEKISKTFVSKESGFKLNPPVRPALELVNVDDDVKYTISEIEDDITSKVDIHGGFNNSYSNWNSDDDSDVNSGFNIGFKRNNPIKLNSKFVQSSQIVTPKYQSKEGLNINNFNVAKTYINPNAQIVSNFLRKLEGGIPNYLNDFIDGVIKQEKSLLSKLGEPMDNSDNNSNLKEVNLEELSILLNKRFSNVSKKYSLNSAYDIQRLREELALNFISDYSSNLEIDVVKKFVKSNLLINDNFNTAIDAGKSLAKYSMERFTDYNNECTHKYKNFIGHFLSNMNTINYLPLGSSFKLSENAKYDKATEKLFLYSDRLKIINNMLTSLSFKSEDLKFKPFLKEFANEYQKNPASEKLDSIIEQKLLSPMGINNFSAYVDRTVYERKGILEKIFGEVKGYFGGVKNA